MTQTRPAGLSSTAGARRGDARLRADLVVLGLEIILVATAVLVGAVLNHRRVPIHADAAPLFASWLPHVGPGTPLALAIALAVIYRGPLRARLMPWRRLMVAGYLAALAWTLALALIDGWARGLATRLTPQGEYLGDVPKVSSIPATVSGFTAHILDFHPGSWATHVSGHPPGVFLIFVVLDRVGLRGGGPAALLCVLVGAVAPVAVAATLRALGDESAARAALPFLVLFPGAVWVGASADGMFMGVVAVGLALLAAGRWPAAIPGGLLLGYALYLSYGMLLVGPLALAIIVGKPRARWATAAVAVSAVAAVVAAFTVAGFWWLTGYHLVVQRYYQGWAAQRPYGYWVWANLACLILSAGPVLGPALYRAGAAVRRGRTGAAVLRSRAGAAVLRSRAGAAVLRSRAGAAVLRNRAGARWPAAGWLPVMSALAIVAADLSGLSKAEVERIWLPYEIWLLAATAWLPPAHRRGWLAIQAITALAANHLLLTKW